MDNGTTLQEPFPDNFRYVSDQARDDIMDLNHGYVQPVVNIFGTIGNIINIIVFLKMGFVETINISLLGLAVSDLGAVVTLQWLNLCQNPFFKSVQLPFDINAIRYVTASWPHVCFTRAGGMITAYIALERCICVTFPLKVKSILTRNVTICVILVICFLNVITIVPYFSVVALGPTFFPSINTSLVGMITFNNTAAVESVVLSFFNFYSYIAVMVVLVCTGVLIRTIQQKSKWRETAASGNDKSPKDAAMGGKDRQVVVMVILISIIFCIGYIPMTIMFILMITVPQFSSYGPYRNLYSVLFAFAGLLESLNCSVNIVTYIAMSTKYRETFWAIRPCRK